MDPVYARARPQARIGVDVLRSGYQPADPRIPLNGPTTELVIQPP